MRTYIITQQEQRIIKAFLERGERLEGFRMLLSRTRKLDIESLHQQLKLIGAFLREVEK